MAHQLNDQACDLLGDFFTIFAHPTRMRILCALQHQPRSVSQIAAYARIALPNASQHLRLMREKGVLAMFKQGQHVHYSIADPRFLQALMLIRAVLLEQIRDKARGVAVTPRRTAADAGCWVGEAASG
jgi:ArsR family transcriptional regulator